jgi:hypothetical protein
MDYESPNNESRDFAPEIAVEKVEEIRALLSTITEELDTLKDHESIAEEERDKMVEFLAIESIQDMIKEYWSDNHDSFRERAGKDGNKFHSIIMGGYSGNTWHKIFRLRYLIDAYFSDNSAFQKLSQTIDELAAVTNLSNFQVDMPPKYPLLQPMTKQKMAEVFEGRIDNAPSVMTEIPSIREKVLATHKAQRDTGGFNFLVDVQMVPVYEVENGSRQIGFSGRVSAMNPADWRL